MILNVKGVTGRKPVTVNVIFGDDAVYGTVSDKLVTLSGKMWSGSKI